jgi:hypothetical protein
MSENFVTLAELTSTSGRDRVRLLYLQAGEGMGFHSITLEVHDEQGWRKRIAITRDQFQGEYSRQRWIANLHSFTPTTGTVIIQVAEGDRPAGAFSTNYAYSWRRWNLLQNIEVAHLKDCKSPFDSL